MRAGVKVLLGIILLILGIAWYLIGVSGIPFLGDLLQEPIVIGTFFHAFIVVFVGLFGLVIILVGVILLWLGVEDLRAPAIKEEFEAPPASKPKPKKKSTKKSGTKKSSKK